MPTKEQFYEISAVSRMTGLSSHVLRVWERRYSVVEPRRSDSQRRQYTQTDVDRLSLLKRLVDNGHAIGSVAELSMEQLRERVEMLPTSNGNGVPSTDPLTKPVQKIGLVGTLLRQIVREVADGSPFLRVTGEFETVEELRETLKVGSVNIIFVERDTLFLEDLDEIQSLVDVMEADQAFVVYRFAESKVLDASHSSINVTALRGPIETAGIRLALGSTVQAPTQRETDGSEFKLDPDVDVPPRMFSHEQLATFSKISPSLQCECPKHLATILRSLAAFEEYSEKCESQNVEDAELHGFLHLTTAQCRFDMEKALAKVLTHEGISY